jgi:hypothetical protein
MRVPTFLLSACAIVATAEVTFAKPEPLKPYDFEVGASGRFGYLGDLYWFEVVEVIGPKDMLVHVTGVKSSGGRPFWVRGLPTDRLADGKRIELTDCFKVTGTSKRGGVTYFVLEPAPDIFGPDPPAPGKLKKMNPKAPAPATLPVEDRAQKRLALIKQLQAEGGEASTVRFRLRKLIEEYPQTKAAGEARQILKKLP